MGGGAAVGAAVAGADVVGAAVVGNVVGGGVGGGVVTTRRKQRWFGCPEAPSGPLFALFATAQ